MTGSPTRTARPWKTAFLAGMASYLDAAVLISTGTALVLYRPTIGIDDLQFGLLSSLLTLCFAVGALFGGRLGDRFGRRTVYSVTLVGLIVAMGVMALASSVPMLFVGVVLAGLAIGADLPVSLALIAEDSPEGQKGRFVAFSAILWLVGISASNGLSAVVGGMGELGGRIMFAHVGVVAIVVLLLRMTLPESPEWLAARARRAAQEDGERIDLDSLRRLFRPPFIYALAATGLFYAAWTIASNTMGQFSALLFTELGGTTIQLFGLIKLVNIPLGLLSGFAFMRIVDTRWRYRWFVVGAVIQIAAFATPLLFDGALWSLMVMTYAFSVGAAFAGEALFKVWSQELYPTLLRSTAQGASIAFARIAAAGAAVFIPTLATQNPSSLFVLLTACIVASSLIGFLWVRVLPTAPSDAVAGTEDDRRTPAETVG
ncbi:MFS transporter [Microbacterium marinilacus]|uniref:MFS transporter n=1 Tax=Microbacterium marinilacus TaxID=415209 RepID=A0ABP7BKP7_9MICO|nr:MFS transporter [Microbacterium marinilacus]MBY0690422.1 MFS transporter [Microbacterium marinilacus]